MDISKYKDNQILALPMIKKVPGCGLSEILSLTQGLMAVFPCPHSFLYPLLGIAQRLFVLTNAQPIRFILPVKNQRLDKHASFKGLPPALQSDTEEI